MREKDGKSVPMEVPIFFLGQKRYDKILVEFKTPSSPIVFRPKKRSRTFAGNSLFIPTCRGDVSLEPSQTMKKNGQLRPEAFFEQQHPADLMPDKTRLPEWSMAVLENPQGDPFELENHDVEDMASASVPKKTLVLQIHEEGKTRNRKRQTLRGWPVLYEDEWENIEKMLKLGTYAASNEIAFFRMGALVEEPQNQDVAKLDADALQNLIHEEHGRAEESGKLSAPRLRWNQGDS